MNIAAKDVIVAYGDSLTAGYPTAAYAWWLPLKAYTDAYYLTTVSASSRAPVLPTAAGVGNLFGGAGSAVVPSPGATGPMDRGRPRWVNSGISGQVVHDTAQPAAISSRVTAFSPNLVIICIGTNDVTQLTPTATFSSDYSSMLAQIQAANSGVRILCLSNWAHAEKWPAGSNSSDSTCDTYDALISAAAASAGVSYFSLRADFFAYETAWNVSNVSWPILTQDGLHPDIVVHAGPMTGAQQFSASVQSILTFTG